MEAPEERELGSDTAHAAACKVASWGTRFDAPWHLPHAAGHADPSGHLRGELA